MEYPQLLLRCGVSARLHLIPEDNHDFHASAERNYRGTMAEASFNMGSRQSDPQAQQRPVVDTKPACSALR